MYFRNPANSTKLTPLNSPIHPVKGYLGPQIQIKVKLNCLC